MAEWKTSSNQTVYDLAIQLYGDITFAVKILIDNNLNWNYQSQTNDIIIYDSNNQDVSLQRQLLQNSTVVATGFQTIGGIPPIIQRDYNNDFSLDFS